MTIHARVLLDPFPLATPRHRHRLPRRLAPRGVESRAHDENPGTTHFDEIREICARYDVTISLGDGLRPGCLADATDAAQFAELETLGELTQRAWEQDVQVMIEGPATSRFDQIEMNVRRSMEICHEAPFYVLGPLVTDIAPGYDHITSAIGAAIAGGRGRDAVLRHAEGAPRPAERGRRAAGVDRLPDRRPRRRSRARQPAGCAVGSRALEGALQFDWKRQFELALDPETARAMHDETLAEEYFKSAEFCSMCGPKYCPMHNFKDVDWDAVRVAVTERKLGRERVVV